MDTAEKYRIERINNDIEYYKKKCTIASITVYTAIEHCNKLTEKQKEKAKKIFQALCKTKQKRKYNVKKQLANRLKKQSESNSYIDNYEVRKSLIKRIESYRIKMEYTDTNKIINEITKNPAQAALSAASDYIQACSQIEHLKKELATPPQKKEIPKKEEPKQTTPRTTYQDPTSTYYKPRTVSTTITDTPTRTPIEQPKEIIPQPYSYSDSDAIKYQKTIEYLTDKYKKDSAKSVYHPAVYFEDEDRKMLEILFGGNKYETLVPIKYVEELIENAYTVEAILNKFNVYKKTHLIPFKNQRVPTLEDLLDMALIIYDELPEELVTLRAASSEKSIFIERLTNQAGVMQFLDKYEQAYNIYMKYYNKLSDEEKNKAKNLFENNYASRYYKLEIKNFEILRPEQLKRLVNNRVRDLMIQNYNLYGNLDTIDIHSRLKKATTFMSPEEIATTYFQIKRKKDQYVSYSNMTEEDIKHRKEWFDKLQHNFAHLLIQKLTKEQKENKTTDQQLYFVCKEYLKEEPRFRLNLNKTVEQEHQKLEELYGSKKAISQATGATVADEKESIINQSMDYTKDISKATNTAVAAGYNAMNRFFGMKKVEQTIQRITGKWSKFEKAWQQAQQATTEEEINELTEEINGMFRR